MASVSQTDPIGRRLTDSEFEELLQRTWEFVNGKAEEPIAHPYESATESPSWT